MNQVTRTWSSPSGTYNPFIDCDLTNPFTQDNRPLGGDLCGVASNTNFGRPTPSLTYDPEVLNGWGSPPTSAVRAIVPE